MPPPLRGKGWMLRQDPNKPNNDWVWLLILIIVNGGWAIPLLLIGACEKIFQKALQTVCNKIICIYNQLVMNIINNQLPDDEWDYYSGLPNPTWYERKANEEIEYEEDEWLQMGHS